MGFLKLFLKELRIIIEEIKKDNPCKELFLPAISEIEKNFKFNIIHDGSNEIIFKEDTFIELGGPKNASSSLILPIKNENELEKIIDGKITIIGKDIDEATENNLNFAQVFLEDQQVSLWGANRFCAALETLAPMSENLHRNDGRLFSKHTISARVCRHNQHALKRGCF